MELFSEFAQKSRLEEFYNDITNAVLFDTPVRFTSKYPQVSNFSQILSSKRALEQLLKSFVCGPSETEEDINNFLLSYSETVNTDILKVLRKIFRMKRNQIRRQMAEKLIAMEGNLLVNFNWKVNVQVHSKQVIVSHSLHILCKKPICSLELIIRVRSQAEQKRITLEMGKDELVEFISVLKKMQANLK